MAALPPRFKAKHGQVVRDMDARGAGADDQYPGLCGSGAFGIAACDGLLRCCRHRLLQHVHAHAHGRRTDEETRFDRLEGRTFPETEKKKVFI